MIVRDVMDILKLRLNNIAVSKNESLLISLINLGVTELYRRFNLSIKSEIVTTSKDIYNYQLKNGDVSLILALYDNKGVELQQSDVIDSPNWGCKITGYKSFILNKPEDNIVLILYQASPVRLMDGMDNIELPDAMLTALMAYVIYMCSSTAITTSNVSAANGGTEADVYFQRYIALCNELENQGYKIPISTESLSVMAKGYI